MRVLKETLTILFLKKQVVSILFSSTILLIPFVFLNNLLVSLSSDIEVNPGSNRKANEALSIYHWKLNSIFALNFAKLHILKTYLTVHKFDIICLSEVYLDSSTPFDDDNLEISDYNLICSDNPSINTCVFILPLRVRDISLLDKCINFQLKITKSSSAAGGTRHLLGNTSTRKYPLFPLYFMTSLFIFPGQCSLQSNDSKPPSRIHYLTEKRSSTIKNGLISQNQSGFKPADSCINQFLFLSVSHEIYKSFGDGFDVRRVFLDTSKAFDKVWHEGIIF